MKICSQCKKTTKASSSFIYVEEVFRDIKIGYVKELLNCNHCNNEITNKTIRDENEARKLLAYITKVGN